MVLRALGNEPSNILDLGGKKHIKNSFKRI